MMQIPNRHLFVNTLWSCVHWTRKTTSTTTAISKAKAIIAPMTPPAIAGVLEPLEPLDPDAVPEELNNKKG